MRLLRRRPAPQWPALLGLLGAATWLVAHYGLRYHTWQPDELLAGNSARYVLHNFPQALWDWGHITDRGLERLTGIVLAFAHALPSDPAQKLELQHVAIAFMFALSALPAYGLARGLGLALPWRLAAAALAVFTPYAVFALSFLNTAAAYFTLTLAFYAIWRAAVEPGVRRDLLALAAIALAGTARVGDIVIAPVLVVAVLVFSLYDRKPGEPVGWRQLPGRIWREHRALVLAAVPVLLAVVVLGPTKVGGSYVLNFDQPRHVFGERLRVVVAQLAQATALVPVIAAAAWSVRQVVRPTDARAATFAAVVIGAYLTLTFASSIAGAEERYVAGLLPVVAVAFVAALARREIGWLSCLFGGALVARAVAVNGRVDDPNPFVSFIAPAERFFAHVVLNRVKVALPFGADHVVAIVTLALVAVLVVAAVLLRRAPRLAPWVAALVVAGAGAYGAAASVYSMKKFTNGATYAALAWKDLTWIDRAAHGERVAILDVDPLSTDTWRPFFYESQMFNYDVIGTVEFGHLSFGCCSLAEPRTWQAAVDPNTGHLAPVYIGHAAGRAPIPRLLLYPPHFSPWGLDTKVVAQSRYLPITLMLLRMSGPFRLSYSFNGGYYDGYLNPAADSYFRVFRPERPSPRGTCLYLSMVPVTGVKGPVPVTVGHRRMRIAPGQTRSMYIRLPELTRRPWQDVHISAPDGAVPLGDQYGRGAAVQLTYAARTACS